MNSKFQAIRKHSWFLIGLFAVALIMFLGSKRYLLGQETPEKSEENLTPTEFPLTVHYIDTKLKKLKVDEVEDILSGIDSLPITLKGQNAPLPFGGGSVNRLSLKAFHNGEWMYILLGGEDNTKNVQVIKHEQYRDAVAILFPVQKVDAKELFSSRMGDINKPVNIWHWKADWEEDMKVANSQNRLNAVYPNAYFIQGAASKAGLDKVGGGVGSGNPLSATSRKSSVEDLNAAKFGTLTPQIHQDVHGNGRWAMGIWTVVVARKLSTPDENDIQFALEDKTYFSIAVWNGGAADRDGQKSISDRWHPLEINPLEK